MLSILDAEMAAEYHDKRYPASPFSAREGARFVKEVSAAAPA
ncbi:hypothetical protein [Edwardsiella hoshinae]|nr:hypothetical protein [Edwardsiella hoshinae]